MHKLIAALAALLFTVSATRADDIVVLRGSVRSTVDAQTALTLPPVVKSYLIINYTNGTYANILYFNKSGKTKSVITASFRLTQATLPNSKTATVATSGFSMDTASDNFSFSTLQLRGANLPLLIENSPAKRSISRPRNFAGTSLTTVAIPGEPSIIRDAKFTLTVDSAKTILANNEDRTLEQTRDAILEALTAQGYMDIL